MAPVINELAEVLTDQSKSATAAYFRIGSSRSIQFVLAFSHRLLGVRMLQFDTRGMRSMPWRRRPPGRTAHFDQVQPPSALETLPFCTPTRSAMLLSFRHARRFRLKFPDVSFESCEVVLENLEVIKNAFPHLGLLLRGSMAGLLNQCGHCEFVFHCLD